MASGSPVGLRLLAGSAGRDGHESLADHQKRLGRRPLGSAELIEVLKESGLRGRGGAWFPTWRKWAGVAAASNGDAMIAVNGSEGEPLSSKDRVLLSSRPHLVLDGAALAAESLNAAGVVIYLSRGSRASELAIERAINERRQAGTVDPPLQIVKTAHRYIAGESSAVINRASGGPSKPRFSLVRSAEKGIDDRPTLVQNAETLAHVAMIARFGAAWFRKLGTAASPGSTLMTLCGNVRKPGVYEVNLGAGLPEVLRAVGGTPTPPSGALLGGYFGSWISASSLGGVSLDVDRLRSEHHASLGCGVVAVLPQGGCGIVEATLILGYLATETSGQCGPCVNGLAALSGAMDRIAASTPEAGDIEKVRRWIEMVRGRGACHHPDGAVSQLASALDVFAEHLGAHLMGRRCGGATTQGFPRPPAPGDRWR